MLKFYKQDGELAGHLTHPDELGLFTDQQYHIKDEDLEAWKLDDLIKGIKAESNRRILSFATLDKQLNAATRANELLDIWRINNTWTDDEQSEHDTLVAAKQFIDAIRSASNALEEMDPIPTNYTDDQYWPQGS